MSPLMSPSMSRVMDDHDKVIAELRVMQDRLRALRRSHCDKASPENTRYHAFSAAVANLNRVIADLEAE